MVLIGRVRRKNPPNTTKTLAIPSPTPSSPNTSKILFILSAKKYKKPIVMIILKYIQTQKKRCI